MKNKTNNIKTIKYSDLDNIKSESKVDSFIWFCKYLFIVLFLLFLYQLYGISFLRINKH